MESQRGPATDKAREAATAAGEAARAKAQSLFQANKQAAVANAGAVAHALRSAADELGGKPLGRFAQRTADRIEGAAHELEQRDLRATLRSIEDYARRSPGMFLGGAFLAGIALARFLKASGERQGGYAPSRGFVPANSGYEGNPREYSERQAGARSSAMDGGPRVEPTSF